MPPRDSVGLSQPVKGTLHSNIVGRICRGDKKRKEHHSNIIGRICRDDKKSKGHSTTAGRICRDDK
ncbi:hypothetical protein KFK09_017893 [Dendrobium nobile]|uniref:Uncharacterized protein n=1 Tax=Dendrobium nobile TaxID=94219 RepID=A0A8T3AZQ2_DENNO|nr:hypothetical protein KFK09_017893 [Dendrobium nobile]